MYPPPFKDLKKSKFVPAKADPQLQKEFIKKYTTLLKDVVCEREPVLFIDAVHPTMATKVSEGWIRKGQDRLIKQSASRTLENVIGSIELNRMKVVTTSPDTVNAETTIAFLTELKAAYPSASTLYIILDQSGYHRSQAVKTFANKNSINLHYLPAYSPNLNPIERLWKLMNEQVRNNHYFTSAKEFRKIIRGFIQYTFSQMLPLLDLFCVYLAMEIKISSE